MQSDVVQELSGRLAALARAGASSVVRVEGRRAASTGVVWSADTIVAAHHAVEWEDELELGLPDGGAARAELVGRDPTTDLAVLRASAPGLAPADWAEPDGLEPGQLVLGVSRPGRSPRASLGVVARVAPEWRAPAGGKLDRYVETSLPLQPGLSGSLVLGASGKALGVATAGLLRGLALVVPAPTLRRVVKGLLAHGHVRRGYLGVATVPCRLPPAAGEEGPRGALLVTAVEPESPAARAGILLGDALVAIAGERVAEPGDLMPVLEEDRIGDAVAVRLVRAGEPREVTLTIGARERGRRHG